MATDSADKQAQILPLSIDELLESESIDRIENDMSHDYYVSGDWSMEFYMIQALRGFIAVGYETSSGQDLLLPQLQFSYCVVDFDRMHLKKSFHKFSNWRLRINHDLSTVLQRLSEYHHNSWLNSSYISLIHRLHSQGPMMICDPIDKSRNLFHLCSIELYDSEDRLVAGELGYVIGRTYTSLSGFCERMKKISVGRIQIIALAKTLEKFRFAFMNLGQPPVGNLMQYKGEIGGKVVNRSEFLKRWKCAVREPPASPLSEFFSLNVSLGELL